MNRTVALVLVFAAGLAAGAVAYGGWRARSAPLPRGAAAAIDASRRNAIVRAAERVSPGVISVSVIQSRVVPSRGGSGSAHEEYWKFFYPPMERRERIPGLGSGVIVDTSGIALTNEHVVRDAEEITVTLTDGRQLPARVLGASSVYDLAVLKIDGRQLPAAPLGDSDDLVVGEWAIAIGNPFGYLLNDPQPTVTAGVISAVNRDIKSEVTASGIYKNMIQTDAAINPGNSGGPLVNGDGQVIGINTFILTSGGGSLGMGFAIPINLAERVLEEIRAHGRVRIAWPGMQVQPVTPYLARRLGYRAPGGLVVTRVEPDGPAARAGVRSTDRILEVDGQPVNSVDDARRSIYGAGVGDRLMLTLERGGEKLEIPVVLEEAPKEQR